MIGNKLKNNENINPNSREMKKLKDALPQYFNNKGEFELEKFQEFLKQEEVDISKEGYGIEFLGKSYAKYLSSLETETYISPDVAHNSKEENKNSENLYIVGDNIDALKHLLSSYAGKIKCIYIDPPYNTGSDGFVYPDNFQFSVEELSRKIGITEEEARRILDLAGKSTHSAWLTFMYPRLVLARDLLTDDGVILVSINDIELGNLLLMLNDIFGENNKLPNFIWQNKKGGGNDSLHIAEETEYILAYSKKIDLLQKLFEPYTDEYLERYSEKDEISKFYWDTFKRKSGKQYYSITAPDGTVLKYDDNGNEISWLRSEARFYRDLEEGEVKFGKTRDGNWNVYFKQRLPQGKKPRNLLTNKGTTSVGSDEILKLFGTNVFSNPKPTTLIIYLLSLFNDRDSIFLDFFSGSATTADAVMQLNAEDEGCRSYILVQLPEKIGEDKPAYKLGYRTIDEVGRARIEKTAEKIKEETNADIDYGYKLYYLETPEEKTLIDLESFEPEIKLVTDDMISIFDNDHSSGKKSILATWLNEDGYGLTATLKPYLLGSYEADLIEKSLYIINEGLEDEDVMTLIKRIENEDLDITRVVVYVHSVRFNVLQELRKNLKVLRNNKNVTLIERF